MNPDSLTSYVVIAVATGVVGALSFLVRNAFGKVETTLESIGGKLDALKADISRGDGDRRVLEVRVTTLEADRAELKREVADLKRELAELRQAISEGGLLR